MTQTISNSALGTQSARLCASGDTTPPNKAPKRKEPQTVPKIRIFATAWLRGRESAPAVRVWNKLQRLPVVMTVLIVSFSIFGNIEFCKVATKEMLSVKK